MAYFDLERGQLPLCLSIEEATTCSKPYKFCSIPKITERLYFETIQKLCKDKVIKRIIERITLGRIKKAYLKVFKKDLESVLPKSMLPKKIPIIPRIKSIEVNGDSYAEVCVELPLTFAFFTIQQNEGEKVRDVIRIASGKVDQYVSYESERITCSLHMDIIKRSDGVYDLSD